MTQKKERPVLQAVLEGGEAAAHALAKGDVLAEFPVIGSAFKVAKAIDSVRDRLLEAKILLFLEGVGNIDDAKRARMQERLSDEKQSHQVGEQLLLTLDKLTSTEKAKLIGCVFNAFVESKIDVIRLRRLVQAIDVAFFDDISEFLQANSLDLHRGSKYMERLIPSGLTRGTVRSYESYSRQAYQVASDGETLRSIFPERQSATVTNGVVESAFSGYLPSDDHES